MPTLHDSAVRSVELESDPPVKGRAHPDIRDAATGMQSWTSLIGASLDDVKRFLQDERDALSDQTDALSNFRRHFCCPPLPGPGQEWFGGRWV
jgi:hypothetical protein